MRHLFLLSLAVLVCCCAVAPAQAPGEQLEPYLVTPVTKGKQTALTLDDKSVVRGKVVGGTDQTVIVADQAGKESEIHVSRVRAVEFQRPRRSLKLDFIGSVIGAVGFGFAGAAIGRTAAEHIHDDHTAGTAGPIIGGLTFGFIGGMLGQKIIRHAVQEDVRLTVAPPELTPNTPAGGQARLSLMPLSQLLAQARAATAASAPAITGHR